MLSYKESLKILKEANALIEGHFILSSGLHSPQYVQCAKLMSKPDKAKKICESLSEKINSEFNKIDKINTKCIEFKNIIKPKIETLESENMTMSEKEKYDLFCKANKEKKYKEGYSQFIGELFNNKMINDLTLEENLSFFVDNLETSVDEDAKSTYVEDLLICVCKLFDTVSQADTNKIISTYCNRVVLIKFNKSLPKRLQFKIMDLHDLLIKKNIIA